MTQLAEKRTTTAWLAPSAEGLVVSVADVQEVWVLDAVKGTPTKKVAVPSLKRAASALNLSTAFASNGFGFIFPDRGGGEFWVRPHSVVGAPKRLLVEGERVEFDIFFGEMGAEAVNVRPLER